MMNIEQDAHIRLMWKHGDWRGACEYLSGALAYCDNDVWSELFLLYMVALDHEIFCIKQMVKAA